MVITIVHRPAQNVGEMLQSRAAAREVNFTKKAKFGVALSQNFLLQNIFRNTDLVRKCLKIKDEKCITACF